MKRAGVIEFPRLRSPLPVIQQAAFLHHGLDVQYESWRTPYLGLRGIVPSLRAPDVLGAEVGERHREVILEYIDERSPDARDNGACTVITKNGGRLVAHHTVAGAFLRALQEDARFDPKGTRALVIGTGNVARAIVCALIRAGTAWVSLTGPSRFQVVSLAEEVGEVFRKLKQPPSIIPWQRQCLSDAARAADLIVHTMAVGMRGSEDEGKTVLHADMISPSTLVCDVVYDPVCTPLLQEAERAHARTLCGLPLLVYLCASAFELWTEHRAPIDVMKKAAEGALQRRDEETE
jgi:shikimate dehydrogenase